MRWFCGSKHDSSGLSTPTTVSFSPLPGTFIYCNNPEQLYPSDLGDHAEGFGNRYLLWSYVTDTCQAYYEHENRTGLMIGYGLQIFNPNEQTVTVKVTNIGFGNNAFDCWKQFYSESSGGGGSVGVFTVAPGEELWVQRNDHAIPAGAIFNGAALFHVTGGGVYVYNYAYHQFGNLDRTASYLGYITRTEPSGQDETHVYKGTSDRFVLTSTINTEVSSLSKKGLSWQTNECSGEDMVNITGPLTDLDHPTYDIFTCADGDNLGNWGIRYRFTDNISNDTRKKRTITLSVAQPYFISNIYVQLPDGGSGRAVNKTTWRFYSFTLPPGDSRTITYEVLLSGSSYGGLTHSITCK
ncbi:MAG: hypothetical protein K0R75_2520 [Paenibacillaceae bacterium]|nr:hypothetical protein [Paenibacillaceae bacterium]